MGMVTVWYRLYLVTLIVNRGKNLEGGLKDIMFFFFQPLLF